MGYVQRPHNTGYDASKRLMFFCHSRPLGKFLDEQIDLSINAQSGKHRLAFAALPFLDASRYSDTSENPHFLCVSSQFEVFSHPTTMG
jgi:hypothetical protein